MNQFSEIAEKINLHTSEPTCEQIEYERKLMELWNDGDGECPQCHGNGFIYNSHESDNAIYRTARRCECQLVQDTRHYLEKSGLRDLVKKHRFDNYTHADKWQDDIYKAATECSKGGGHWFYIGGQSGSGKTHICVALVNTLITSGMSGRYMLWRDVIDKIKGTSIDGVKHTELLQSFKDTNVLYIDDLFKTGRNGTPTPADIQVVFELIDSRARDEKKITIISSEFPISGILGIDEAVGGRIKERAGKYVLSIDNDIGKNYRLKH